MKAGELIKVLSELDPETEIYIQGEWDSIMGDANVYPCSLSKETYSYYYTKKGHKVLTPTYSNYSENDKVEDIYIIS